MIHAIHLARLNYKNDKKSYRVLSFLFISCLTLIFILTLLTKGFLQLENSYKTDDVSLREIEMWLEDSDSGEISYDEEKNHKIACLNGVEAVSQYFNVIFQTNYNILIDDISIKCLPYIRGVNRHYSFAPASKIQKKGAPPIIAGRNVSDSNNREALISENLCYLLTYNTPEEAIGKKIKVVLSDKLISEVEIVGVFGFQFSDYGSKLSELDPISRKCLLESVQSNPFYFSDGLLQEIITSEDVLWWSYENLKVLCQSTDYVKNICDFAQSTCGYTTRSQIDTIEKKAEQVRSISVFLILLIIIVLLIAFIVILNTLSVKIMHQRKFSEMLMKIGFLRREIILSYILQNVFVTIKAGCISCLISFLAGVGIDSVFQGVYREISEKAKFVFMLDFSSSLAIIGTLCVLIIIATWAEAMVQVLKTETVLRGKNE